MLGWYIQIFKIIKPSAFKNKMFVTQTHNEPYSWTIIKKNTVREFLRKNIKSIKIKNIRSH
jgi:hypothetical protein